MSFRSFIFDVGNVLLRWSPADILRSALPPSTDRDRYARGIFSHSRWIDLDRGHVTEKEAAPEFAANVGCSVAEILRILRIAQDSLIPLSPGVALLDELHELGRDLICLTNMSRETFVHVRAKYGFWTHFRGIVISGHVKMVKLEHEIFRYTLERYWLDAAATVFIDDQKANTESARSLGITAIEYDGSESCLARIRGLASKG